MEWLPIGLGIFGGVGGTLLVGFLKDLYQRGRHSATLEGQKDKLADTISTFNKNVEDLKDDIDKQIGELKQEVETLRKTVNTMSQTQEGQKERMNSISRDHERLYDTLDKLDATIDRATAKNAETSQQIAQELAANRATITGFTDMMQLILERKFLLGGP